MRHGRAKAARKTLQFFRLNVGIHPPYHVLLDGCFLVAMISQKVPLVERLEKVLQHAQFACYVTRSSLNELKRLNEQTKKQVFQQARQYGLDECHIIEARDIPSEETKDVQTKHLESEHLGQAGIDVVCLTGGKRHYLVATQDESLLDICRRDGTVPLIRLARGVVLLENPSKASQQRASNEERCKWNRGGSVPNPKERALVQQVREEQKSRQTLNQPRTELQRKQQRVKPKAKGPNPLSCKKKRKNPQEEPAKKKRRKRKKRGQDVEEN